MSIHRFKGQGLRCEVASRFFPHSALCTVSFLCKIGAMVVGVLVLATRTVGADVERSVSVYLSQTYSDNLFGNYVPKSDWISSGDVEVRYGGSHGLVLAYRGVLHGFAEYTDLLNHRHRVGLLYSSASGGGRNALYAGIQGQIRRDRPLYAYYDHDQGRGYVRVKYYLTPQTLGRMGYEVRTRSYPQYDEQDFLVQEVFVQLNRFLPTRTTLRMELGWGAKRYEAQSVWAEGGTAHQATAEVKIAQSLGTNTGAQLRYRRWSQPSGAWRDWVRDGYYEENPFEDHYSYGGGEIQSVVKYRGAWGMALELGGTVLTKRYHGVPALDLSGLPLEPERTRKDQQMRVYVGVEQPLDVWLPDRLPGASLRLEYVYKRNTSNDLYYTYSAHFFSSGVGIYF